MLAQAPAVKSRLTPQQCRHGPGPFGPHLAREPDDIGGQDRGEAALEFSLPPFAVLPSPPYGNATPYGPFCAGYGNLRLLWSNNPAHTLSPSGHWMRKHRR